MMDRDRLTVLIVEDQLINRQILCRILQDEYDVVEAENGEAAMETLRSGREISAILLDIVMPVMDGYAVLREIKDSPYASIPVIVMTGETDIAAEQKALDLGAWDFVPKPYQPSVLLLRLKNVIVRSQFYLISEMKYAYEHDTLTDLYNRNSFFSRTRKMLEDDPDERYALVRLDVNKFHVFNSYWGEEEGNRLLRYIADSIRTDAKELDRCTYARINADAFCMCEPYDESIINAQAEKFRQRLADYNKDYLIEPCVGVYIIDDPRQNIVTMLELATLAAKECKSRYMTYIQYYHPEMSDKVLQEQNIVNDMHAALEDEQFVVYLQPKYNLKTERPYGAEALIRWQHPEKGFLSPGLFIPVFERNGFIGKVDYYMWEHVCALLRKWLDEGLDPAPISVNMSRVNLYNPNLVELLTGLVKKYRLPARLLNLELTESAYMENPEVMEKMIRRLQAAGFTIFMDDFGSGYSSLNTLKNIPVDVLKIDMAFLAGNTAMGRNECILAAVIRMAGWLEIPVVMEGVETQRQVEFLKSVGCGYVQGYYYAKPMPVADYEALVRGVKQTPAETMSENHEVMARTIWSSGEQINLLFNSIKIPAAIFEVGDDGFNALRVNESYNRLFGYGDTAGDNLDKAYGRHMPPESAALAEEAFRRAAENRGEAECEYDIVMGDGSVKRAHMDIQYWGANGNMKIVFVMLLGMDDGAPETCRAD
jgi:EAL domain-containing protein (putative c-di-GMP-specific phosphodiesterase class I)/DNA-binding response OmpR family regulator